MASIVHIPFSFRVMTINIHKGFSAFNRRFVLPEIRESLRGVGAEVVMLQEVHGDCTPSAALPGEDRWPDVPHHEYMAEGFWPEHAYGRNAVDRQGDHGNAVLSRFVIEHWCNHDVTEPHDNEPRGIMRCRLRVPGLDQLVHVVSLHLSLDERARQRQVERLGVLVAAHVPADAPLVVGGDFNDWRGKTRRALALMGFWEVHAGRNDRPPRTFPASLPLLRLDRIYVRGVRRHLPLDLPRRPWNRLSDHLPLAAQIEI